MRVRSCGTRGLYAPAVRRSPASSSWNIGAANAAVFVFAESHIARRLRRMARRARMRPILTIALTVRPASARAAAITSSSFCSDAVGFAAAASAATAQSDLPRLLLHFLRPAAAGPRRVGGGDLEIGLN
jgi:hypothetical protein